MQYRNNDLPCRGFVFTSEGSLSRIIVDRQHVSGIEVREGGGGGGKKARLYGFLKDYAEN